MKGSRKSLVTALIPVAILAGCAYLKRQNTPKELPVEESRQFSGEAFSEHVRTTEARTPEEEKAGFKLPPGFEIELFAAEPQIGKPINLAFDAKGRVWITESFEYPFAADPGAGKDRITILEDRDGDGQADVFTHLADTLNIPIGVLPVPGGAVAHSIPDVYRFTDANGDGVAPGSTTITVATQDGAKTATCTVTVTAAASQETRIYAAGKVNNETMQLKVNGTVLQTWNNVGGNAANGTFVEHTYTSSSSLANAEVHFTNDGGTGDLRIDRITVYQAENAQSFDAWGGSAFNPAGEWLFCNGYKKFTSITAARATAYEGVREDARLRVYPVPSPDGTMQVELKEAGAPYELRVLDSRGVEVYRAGNVKNKLPL